MCKQAWHSLRPPQAPFPQVCTRRATTPTPAWLTATQLDPTSSAITQPSTFPQPPHLSSASSCSISCWPRSRAAALAAPAGADAGWDADADAPPGAAGSAPHSLREGCGCGATCHHVMSRDTSCGWCGGLVVRGEPLFISTTPALTSTCPLTARLHCCAASGPVQTCILGGVRSLQQTHGNN